MKYATQLTPSNNPANKSVQKAVISNGIPEIAGLFEDFNACCLRKNYSFRTREAYWAWIKRFMLFHRKRHPSEMGISEVEQFLGHLVVQGHATVSTRNQALSALQFLYREVLQQHSGGVENAARVKLPAQVPGALTADEMNRVLSGLNGYYRLMASLLYGTGMQVMECVRLRVRDVCFARHEILVRDGRDELVRRLKIPLELHLTLKAHMEKVFEEHSEDMKSNWQGVYMPGVLQIEYPNAGKLLAWQYVFVANRLSHDPRDNKIRRYHVDEKEFQRALVKAALDAGINKHFSGHSLRTDMTASPLFRAT